jgi:hypothetical protein
MRVRFLLLLLLVFGLLLAVQWQFSSYTPGTTYATSGSGTSVLVVAKENYLYARIQIVVQAYNLSFNGTQLQPVTLTFPNGTTVQITGTEEFNLVLPNSVYYTFTSYGAGGLGYSVSSGEPFDVGFLTGQNTTNPASNQTSLTSVQGGIDVYQYLITGDAAVQVSGMWVRL